LDTFDDILLLKRDVTTPTFCHTRDELQQPVEAVLNFEKFASIEK
jgi:hypothetical protein